MKIKTIVSILGAALVPAVSLSAAAGASSVTSEKDGVLRREDMQVVSVTVVVEAIDPATRQATLRDAEGNRIDLTVAPDVQRINEIAAGDTVRVEYVASIAAELRPPTAQELAEPLSVVTGGGRTPAGTAPAGAIGAQIRAVTTVEVLDRLDGTITVKGPKGNILTAVVKDPERLKAVRIGDTIVITYTEAVAVLLEKVTPPPAGG